MTCGNAVHLPSTRAELFFQNHTPLSSSVQAGILAYNTSTTHDCTAADGVRLALCTLHAAIAQGPAGLGQTSLNAMDGK